MSYYDNKMMSDVKNGMTAQPETASPDAVDDYRPFRRKAALRQEIEVDEAPIETPVVETPVIEPVANSPHILTEDERLETLPAVVPDTWDQLRQVSFGGQRGLLSRAPLVSFFRDTPSARAFDILRTRLLQTLKHEGWTRVAIAAPTSGCGTTFTATNLALSLARVPGSRTVLMDMNMRDPGVKSALDVAAKGDQEAFLAGQKTASEHLVRCSDTLALGLADGPGKNPAELLQSPDCAEVLDKMIGDLDPDVVLYDMPSVLAYDDLTAFTPQLDGVLLVSDGEQTTSDQIKACEKVFGGHVPLLGIILNRGRGSSLEAYAS